MNPGHAALAQRDHQHVVLRAQQLRQLPAQPFRLTPRQPHPEHRVLHPLTVSLQVPRRLPQPPRVADVVAHQPPPRPLHGPPLIAAANGRTTPARRSTPSPAAGPPTPGPGRTTASSSAPGASTTPPPLPPTDRWPCPRPTPTATPWPG